MKLVVLILIVLIVTNTSIFAHRLDSVSLGNVVVDEVVSIDDGGILVVRAMNTPGIYLYNARIILADVVLPRLNSSCGIERQRARLAGRFMAKKRPDANKIELRYPKQPSSVLMAYTAAMVAYVVVDGVGWEGVGCF